MNENQGHKWIRELKPEEIKPSKLGRAIALLELEAEKYKGDGDAIEELKSAAELLKSFNDR